MANPKRHPRAVCHRPDILTSAGGHRRFQKAFDCSGPLAAALHFNNYLLSATLRLMKS
jgi:hypothetical protein